MGDLRFAVLLATTALGGYFNRDDRFVQFLEIYNDEFSQKSTLRKEFQKTFDFIDECGFPNKSRFWRKADLFTLIIELFFLINRDEFLPDTYASAERLINFYDEVDEGKFSQTDLSSIYYKATVQASNDRVNRLRRGAIVGGLLRGLTHEQILAELIRERLN